MYAAQPIREIVASLREELAAASMHLAAMSREVAAMHRTVTPPTRLPNREQSIIVGLGVGGAQGIVQLRTYGRHYNMVFCPATLAAFMNVPGVGIGITANLAAGWNVLNVPDGTELYSTAAGSTTLLYRVTDDPQGGVF